MATIPTPFDPSLALLSGAELETVPNAVPRKPDVLQQIMGSSTPQLEDPELDIDKLMKETKDYYTQRRSELAKQRAEAAKTFDNLLAEQKQSVAEKRYGVKPGEPPTKYQKFGIVMDSLLGAAARRPTLQDEAWKQAMEKYKVQAPLLRSLDQADVTLQKAQMVETGTLAAKQAALAAKKDADQAKLQLGKQKIITDAAKAISLDAHRKAMEEIGRNIAQTKADSVAKSRTAEQRAAEWGKNTAIAQGLEEGTPAFQAVEQQAYIKFLQEAAQATQKPEKPDKPPRSIMLVPNEGGEGYTAQIVTPGAQVAPGAVTPAGASAMNVPTAPTRTMAEAAPKVIRFTQRINGLIDQQEKMLGPLQSRWADFMAGKVGAPNKEFTQLRTDVRLLQTLLMRMHVGARGGQQMLEHFHSLIDEAKQDPVNLRAALEEIRGYAEDVAKVSGVKGTSVPTAPKPTHRFNPATGKIEPIK